MTNAALVARKLAVLEEHLLPEGVASFSAFAAAVSAFLQRVP